MRETSGWNSREMKRTILLIMTILFCLSFLPLSVLAEEDGSAVAVVEMVDAVAEEAVNVSGTVDVAVEEAVNVSGTVDAVAEEAVDVSGTVDVAVEEAETVSDQVDAAIEEPETVPETEDTISEEILPEGRVREEKKGITISGQDIAIENGNYSYKLVIGKAGSVTFDNELRIEYQGVSGRYSLHYDIIEPDNHLMIVTGTFDNILLASPLIKRGRDKISEDSYSYQLVLKTKEGFSFTNCLSFLFNGNKHGYSIDFCYDRSTGKMASALRKMR